MTPFAGTRSDAAAAGCRAPAARIRRYKETGIRGDDRRGYRRDGDTEVLFHSVGPSGPVGANIFFVFLVYTNTHMYKYYIYKFFCQNFWVFN